VKLTPLRYLVLTYVLYHFALFIFKEYAYGLTLANTFSAVSVVKWERLSRNEQDYKWEKQVSHAKFDTGIALNTIIEKADTHCGMILKCIGFEVLTAMVVKTFIFFRVDFQRTTRNFIPRDII
jgi:hypothetical protein